VPFVVSLRNGLVWAYSSTVATDSSSIWSTRALTWLVCSLPEVERGVGVLYEDEDVSDGFSTSKDRWRMGVEFEPRDGVFDSRSSTVELDIRGASCGGSSGGRRPARRLGIRPT
jgi:hypothetical protein